MIKTRLVDPELKEEKKKGKPTIIPWKNSQMLRAHSLRASVKDVISMLQVLDVVKIGIIGDQSTGKTTLGDTLAHLIHKMSPLPFSVRSFGEKEFLDFQATLAALPPANYILKFHDLSFLKGSYGAKKIEELKAAMTKIRHLPGGHDVKIVLIYDYHYTMALDKYLRQANLRYFTSVGSSEKDNMLDIVGKTYQSMVEEFMAMFVEMTIDHTATFRITNSKFFKYDYKSPFVVSLFYNNRSLRYIVFPLRTWIDPICSICATGNNPLLQSAIDVKKFREDRDALFGPRVYEAALKAYLFAHGKTTYSGPITQAIRDIERSLEMGIIAEEDMAVAWGLSITNTKLRKKPAAILLGNNEPKKD